MPKKISPQQAKAEIHSAAECALLDIREHGQYGEGHPFLSVHCPYSDFEQTVARLVPNTGVSVILMDDGDGVAQKAAAILQAMGYTKVAIMEGGAPAWKNAGYTLYKGVNLPSKTLGEVVEHHEHPKVITAQTLHEWKSQNKPMHFFDCRPPNEYDKMTIPGAQCVPNGELAHRLGALVHDDQTPIVVTCAGRTRGLIGAAGLERLGLPNPIYAVENGTQGWALAGYQLNHKNGQPEMPALDAQALAKSRERADAVIAKEGLTCINRQEFETLANDTSRTLYLVDVRSISEYRAGHLPGAVHSWSGQVSQASDLIIGVRRARVVLSDDTGMRAAIAAVWLKAIQYEVYILRETSPTGLAPNWQRNAPSLPKVASLPEVSAQEAWKQASEGQVQLIDLRNSQDFRKAHAKGAAWATRARLGDLNTALPAVLLADDAQTAAYTATDLQQANVRVHGIISGGMPAWENAGLPVESSANLPADSDCIDFLFFVHDRHDGNLESARRYLEWETGLIAQMDAQEHASFNLK
jgi:rhodanese-related sulfurtransferase